MSYAWRCGGLMVSVIASASNSPGFTNKRGKFLELWWGVLQNNLTLSNGFIMWIGHCKEISKLTFRALPFVGANRGIVGCVRFINKKMELHYWLVAGNVKKLNENCSLISWRLRVSIWKINFWSSVLRLSVLSWCMERPQGSTESHKTLEIETIPWKVCTNDFYSRVAMRKRNEWVRAANEWVFGCIITSLNQFWVWSRVCCTCVLRYLLHKLCVY